MKWEQLGMPACTCGRKVFVYNSSLSRELVQTGAPWPCSKINENPLWLWFFLLFHLTFKLYLLGKPGISKPEWFGCGWKPKPQCGCTMLRLGLGLVLGGLQHTTTPHCHSWGASCCRICWWLAWAFFLKSPLVLLCSSQDRKGRNKLWSCYYYFFFFPFWLEVLGVLKEKHIWSLSRHPTGLPLQRPFLFGHRPHCATSASAPQSHFAASACLPPKLVCLWSLCVVVFLPAASFKCFHRTLCDQEVAEAPKQALYI